jgi:recombination protein RecA
VNKTNTCVIFINQLREKVGVLFGNPETTTGGRALKFYSSMRFDVRKVETIKQGENMLGSRTRVKVVKNKVAPPFKKAEFDIMYGKGISLSGDILDCAVENGIVKKSGSWYSYEGDRIGQGREAVKAYLEDNPELMNKIKNELMDSLKPKNEDESRESAPADIPGVSDAGESTVTVDEDGVIIE